MAEAIRRPVSGGTYLVVLGDYIVALDLVQTVVDFCPAAQVIQKSTATAAVAAVSKVNSVKVAFIGEPPHSFARSELARLIAKKGGRVVFVGDEAEGLGPASGHMVLSRPFSTPTVLALLKQAPFPRAEHCDEFARQGSRGRMMGHVQVQSACSGAMHSPKVNP